MHCPLLCNQNIIYIHLKNLGKEVFSLSSFCNKNILYIHTKNLGQTSSHPVANIMRVLIG